MVHCIPQFTVISHLYHPWYIVSFSLQLLLIFTTHGTLYPPVHSYFSSSPPMVHCILHSYFSSSLPMVHCIPQFTVTFHLDHPWHIVSFSSQLLLIFHMSGTLYPSVHICLLSSPTMVHFILHSYFLSLLPMVHCIPQFTVTSHLHLPWYIVSLSLQLLLIFTTHGTMYASIYIYLSSSSPMAHCTTEFTVTSHLHHPWYIVSLSSQLLLIFTTHGTLYPLVHSYFPSSPPMVHCIPQFTVTSHFHHP